MTTPADLVVHPDDLARTLRIPLPLDGEVEWTLRQAILAVQSDVESHLGRPVTPRVYVESGVWPGGLGGQWPLAQDRVLSIVSAVPDVSADGYVYGTFTVTYLAGLDGRNDPDLAPIRRYVMAWAALDPSVAPHVPAARREITNVSVEGQSVGFRAVGGVDPATLPVEQRLPQLKGLDRWRLAGRRVFQRRG